MRPETLLDTLERIKPNKTTARSRCPATRDKGSKAEPEPVHATINGIRPNKITARSHPITTQGKILKAEAKKIPLNISRSPPPKKVKRPEKPISLPPPEEMANIANELERALQKELEKSARPQRSKIKKSGSNLNKHKPITTQQKKARVETLQRMKQGVPTEDVGEIATGEWLGMARRPGMIKLIDAQSTANTLGLDPRMPFLKTIRQDKGVLYRPTERAKRFCVSGNGKGRAAENSRGIFRFMDLPRDVRHRIYGFAVIYPFLIVWPDSPGGREQPDLAMTCRDIRRDVLEAYYGGNIFGVVIALNQKPYLSKKNIREPKGLAAVHMWARALSAPENEGGMWFARIRKWTFEWRSPESSAPTFEDSWLVKLEFPLEEEVEASSKMKGKVSALQQHMYKLRPLWLTSTQGTGRLPAISKSPITEIHREATCILPSWPKCGQCIVQPCPERMDEAVIRMLEESSKQGRLVTGKALVDLAVDLRGMAEGVGRQTCLHGQRSGEDDRDAARIRSWQQSGGGVHL